MVVEIIILSLIGVSLAEEFVKRAQVDAETTKLEQELATYQGENQKIKSMIEFTKSESFFEGEARQRLGLAKPGEKVIIVRNSDNQNDTSPSQNTDVPRGIVGAQAPRPQDLVSIPTKYHNVVNWWNYFFGY